MTAVVMEKEEPVSVPFGDAELGRVPQLGQPLADCRTIWNGREVVFAQFVLGRDPLLGFVGTTLFKPAVRIGDFGSEIVVGRFAPAAEWIFDSW